MVEVEPHYALTGNRYLWGCRLCDYRVSSGESDALLDAATNHLNGHDRDDVVGLYPGWGE